MSDDEEDFSLIGFNGAIDALSKENTAAAIQKAAREIVDTEISICYTRLGVREHEIYFMVHTGPQSNLKAAVISSLMAKLASLLEYDEVSVLEESDYTEAVFNDQYALLTRVFPGNLDAIRKSLKEYCDYLERKKTTGEYYFEAKIFPEAEKKSDAQHLKTLALMPGVPESSQKRHKSSSENSTATPEGTSSPSPKSPDGKKF